MTKASKKEALREEPTTVSEAATMNSETSAITDEPQHPEHLHMEVLGEEPSLRAMYLRVSDDQGEFFGDTELEKAMIDLSSEIEEKIGTGSTEELGAFMARLIDTSTKYHRQLNLAGNLTSGILVKHQLRLGKIYRQQQRLLKKIDSNAKWLDWFKETYGASSLRSAQDFMRLADTPNIIRYAVFGRERLLEILRGISPYGTSDDPIGEFLSKYDFTFNPEEEIFMEGWKTVIDAAVAMEKIKKVERKEDLSLGVTFDGIRNVIEGGVPVDSSVIGNMLIVKESGGSVEEYLENTVLAKGPKPALIERAERKETVQVLSRKLKELIEFYTRDREAIAQINTDAVRELRESIEALAALIAE